MARYTVALVVFACVALFAGVAGAQPETDTVTSDTDSGLLAGEGSLLGPPLGDASGCAAYDYRDDALRAYLPDDVPLDEPYGDADLVCPDLPLRPEADDDLTVPTRIDTGAGGSASR